MFETWNVDLTGEQEQQFETEHFNPMWSQYAGASDFAKLNVANSVPFMFDMMGLTFAEKQKQ